MKIYIPHLHYTVYVRKFKKPPDGVPNAQAFARNIDDHSCEIFLPKREKQSPGDVAHELIHVLQFIALSRNLDFKLEQEHFGYLMHYLMGKVLGFSYK